MRHWRLNSGAKPRRFAFRPRVPWAGEMDAGLALMTASVPKSVTAGVRRSAVTAALNATLGLAGLFDVATMLGMKRTKEDAGKTIGMWAGKGVEPENGGFYLVLPLVGPSNARDATGLMIDYAIDPFQILPIALNVDWFYYSIPRYGLNVIDYRSRTMFALDDIEKNSVDYYAALRSAYTQNRADLIRAKPD